jgi:hypothetical protein
MMSVMEMFQQSGSAKLRAASGRGDCCFNFAGLEYVFVILAEDRRWPISPLEPSCPKRLGRMTDYALVDFDKFDIEPYQPYKRDDSKQDFN